MYETCRHERGCDAFVNSAITGVNGGLVVLAADDPSMHSSQNEQDSRFLWKICYDSHAGTVLPNKKHTI